MFACFYPDQEAASAYVIPYEELYKQGYRGIIFDIDNTLVPHGAPADERSVRLFDRLRKIGYRTILLSNNKEPRVKMFHDDVGADYIYKAGKPAVAGYRRAMEKMGTDRENTFLWETSFLPISGEQKGRGCGRFSPNLLIPRKKYRLF